MPDKILIVEDEPKIARTLRLYLEEAGFAPFTVHDGAQAIPAFRQERPALVLLDLNLPGRDGIAVCQALRRDSDVPIIMLTARIDEVDRLLGLELGADDYIVKPFSPREVVARIRAILRRASGELTGQDIVRAGDLLIDLAAYRASLGDQALPLTQSEFEILSALARNAGRVMSRTQLLDSTQGIAYEGYERTIDQHIKNLRRKIRQVGGHSELIQTVYGVGYRLDPLSTAGPAAGNDVP
jgi:two-component system alkaline phosphatase synthesis response regulator PhoP